MIGNGCQRPLPRMTGPTLAGRAYILGWRDTHCHVLLGPTLALQALALLWWAFVLHDGSYTYITTPIHLNYGPCFNMIGFCATWWALHLHHGRTLVFMAGALIWWISTYTTWRALHLHYETNTCISGRCRNEARRKCDVMGSLHCMTGSTLPLRDIMQVLRHYEPYTCMMCHALALRAPALIWWASVRHDDPCRVMLLLPMNY